jgi:predicted ATPase/class 3 adenylate cyclase
MTALPSGTVAFLFTDIEGSSRLWERDRAAMARAAARHDALLADAIAAQDGVLFKHVGDMVQAAFASPIAAVGAAVAAQRALAAEPWPETGPIRVRMGLHLGEAVPNAQGDYHQVACLNRLSRLMSAGHGGQVLLSDVVRQVVAGQLPAGVTLRDLGRHRLRDLLDPEQIAQLVITGLPADFPPLKTLEGHPTNLPTLATALLGREVELADIASLLKEDGRRLVTLVGPGGVGKTHLALQAAADLLERYPDGVWLVRLGEISDPAMILPAVAATLGVREGGGLDMREALLHWIGGKRILLVLDNLEQIVAGAPVIAELLAACPNTRVLATSRQRLAIGGELVLAVQPLTVEPEVGSRKSGEVAPPTSDLRPPTPVAVQLFVARAQDVVPDFAIDERDAATIAAICARLDGLPLAIELAAAQLRTRTLPELLADLERRFELLVGGRREALSHQQSLAATIAWSYERLDPETQRLLHLLSTFAGGWSREAAAQIAAELDDVPQRLGALVEQSLVRRNVVLEETSRWSMLESIRAFARERLTESGEEELAHERHAAWCLAFAETAAAHLEGEGQEAWLARLDLEHDNGRVALRWWRDAGEGERSLELATALAPFWEMRGYLSEGRRWLEAALATTPVDAPVRLRALVEAGILAHSQGDHGDAAAWCRQALDLAREVGDRGRETAMLNNLGGVALDQGNLDEAERRFSECLALATTLGDERRRAYTLANLAVTAQMRGDFALALQRCLESLAVWRQLGDARRIAELLLTVVYLLSTDPQQRDRAMSAGEEALRRFRALGDPHGEAIALDGLGVITAAEGDLDRAAALHEEGLRLARSIEDRATEAQVVGNLGLVELDRGRLERARGLLERNLALVQALGEAEGLTWALSAMAALDGACGDDEQAARLLGAADALRAHLAIPLQAQLRPRQEKLEEQLGERLGERFAELRRKGAALSAEDAAGMALRRAPAAASNDPLAALDELLAALPSRQGDRM